MSTNVTFANIFNTTSPNNDCTPEITRVLLNALQSVVLSFSLYLFVVLLWYEISLRTTSSTTCTGPNRTNTDSDASRRIGKYLRFLLIFCAILCICICVNDLVFYNFQVNTYERCNAAKNTKLLLLAVVDMAIYIFLWLRQYVIYESLLFETRVVQYLITFLKWLTLALIGALFLVTNGLIACCRRYHYDNVTDRCTNETPVGVNSAFGYIWTTGSIILHCTLVMMFVVPLIRLTKTTNKISSSKGSPSSRRMTALVRRCFGITVFCVITDLLILVIADYILTARHQKPFKNLIYNINILINSTLLVASFGEWKQMLMPWRKVLIARCNRASSESAVNTQSELMQVQTVH